MISKPSACYRHMPWSQPKYVFWLRCITRTHRWCFKKFVSDGSFSYPKLVNTVFIEIFACNGKCSYSYLCNSVELLRYSQQKMCVCVCWGVGGGGEGG